MVSESKQTAVFKPSDLEYSEEYNHDLIKLCRGDLLFIRLMQMSTILTVSAHNFLQMKNLEIQLIRINIFLSE